jgi:hypothetical protein
MVSELYIKMNRPLAEVEAAPKDQLEILDVVPGKILFESLIHIGLFDFRKHNVSSLSDLLQYLESSFPDWRARKDHYEKTGRNLP